MPPDPSPPVTSVTSGDNSEGFDSRVYQPFGGKSPYTDGTPDARPQMLPSMLWQDIGSSGLRQYSGWVREEFLRALQGREAARVFREMRDNSATIGALMFAIHQTMRKIDWKEERQSDDADQDFYTDFAHSLRFDMSNGWDEFVAEALSMLEYGFAPVELVYKRRQGQRKQMVYDVRGKPMLAGADEGSSNHDDGLIGIRRMPLRGQETILRWYFDPNGQITGMQQQPWQGPLIDIPIEKLLIFRPLHYKNNPEGRSILRNAYRAYFFSKRIEEEEAILFERMNGFPVLKVPQELLEAAAGTGPAAVQASQTLEYYKKLITNVRIDEQMGVILPSNTFNGPNGPSNVPMYEFELMLPKGAGGHTVDAEKVLGRYSLDILKTSMADFIDLGHQARGTQNLAISKVDMFFQAISGWLTAMAGVLNKYMLPRVWRLNGWSSDTVPQYVPDLAQRIDLEAISNFVLRLSQAGARLFPDDDLENYLRDAAGMPSLDDDADYQPLQTLVNPASQVITPPGSTGGAKPVQGTPTGGAGSGGPLAKSDGPSEPQSPGGQVADAILFEVAKEIRRQRPAYRVQGDRAKVKRRTVVRAAA
jgi:hypothetical protein